MKITYDAGADALRILLRDAEARSRVEIEQGVTVDLDSEGHIMGVEILDAGQRLSPKELINMSYKNPLLASAPER